MRERRERKREMEREGRDTRTCSFLVILKDKVTKCGYVFVCVLVGQNKHTQTSQGD